MHHIVPSRADVRETFASLPRDRPIHMLNLPRFRETAEYPAGHPNADKGWSGEEAYREYGRSSAPYFAGVGGSIVWRGNCEMMVIGPEEER